MLYDYVQDDEVNQSPPGSWTTASHPEASGGSYIGTSLDGASVYWNFYGNGASVVYVIQPGGGIGDVYADGDFLGSIVMGGPVTYRAEKAFTWSGSPTDMHTLRLTHRVGTGPIWMDAFRSGVSSTAGHALAVLTSEPTVGTATVAATAVSQTVGPVPVLLQGFTAVRFDPADLVITKTVEPAGDVSIGQKITFTLTYQNLGPSTATSAYIDDVIGDTVLSTGWLQDVFFSRSPLIVTPHLHYWWSLGSLAPGQSGVIQFGGTIATNRYWPSGSVITNTALIDSSTADIRRGNNRRRVTFTIVPSVPATMTLTAMPVSIPVGGDTSLLRATVRDMYGNPVANGTAVTFDTNLGGFPTLQNRVRYTTGGVATVNLTSGSVAGTASVTATVDSITANTRVIFTPLGSRTLTLTANPDVIPVGGATSIIKAEVVDRFGNWVVDGTVVTFDTTEGTIAPTGVGTFNGKASSVLRSSNVPVTATVSATAGAASDMTTVRFVPGVPRVTITASRVSLPVSNTSYITVVARDDFGNPVLDGTVVSFTASLGHFTDSMISKTFASTLGGRAFARLHSTQSGASIVEAVVSTQSAAIVITFDPGPPYSIEIGGVEPGIIAGCGGTAIATALVKDRYGNPVADGTVVVFDVIPQGDADPIDGGRTTGGVARAIISSGTVPGPAFVHAWPEGYRGSAFDDFPVVFEAGPPDRLEVSAVPPRLIVGGNQATIRVHALDCGGFAVDEGTLVTFTIVSGGGSLSPPAGGAAGEGSLSPQTTSTVNGWAYSALTSPDLTGSATIRVAAGDLEATVVVEYIPGPAFDIVLTAVPLSIPANGVSTSTIGAEVRDRYGNAVADRTAVSFSTELGRFETGPSYGTFTLGGRASAILSSHITPGIARVSAVAAGKRGEIYVDFYFDPTPTPPPTSRFTLRLPIIVKNHRR
jgi:uncharacterized repeat protein (TIGR01451 family)